MLEQWFDKSMSTLHCLQSVFFVSKELIIKHLFQLQGMGEKC